MARPTKKQNQKSIVTFDQDGTMHVHSTDQRVRDLIFACRDSEDGLEIFCKFFLPSSFKRPFTEDHKDFARRLSDLSLPQTWEIARRGFGKSTICWAEVIRRICFRLSCFIVYASNEMDNGAEAKTEAVRAALINTPKIREYFGVMSPKFEDGMRDKFSKKAFILVDPETNQSFCLVVPRSVGDTQSTSVRGLLYYVASRMRRPDFLVCDDITNKRRVHDEVYLKSHVSHLLEELFPCVDNEEQPDSHTHKWPNARGERAPWCLAVIDTAKHPGCAVEQMAQMPGWFGARHPMAVEVEPGVFKSLVKTLSDEQITNIWKRHQSIGNDDGFYREYLCGYNTSEASKFPKTFQRYTDDRSLNHMDHIHRVIIVDPARTRNLRSSFTAMLSIAVDCRTAKVYLRGMRHARMSIEEFTETLFGFAKDMNARYLAVEDNGLNDWIRGPLEKEASKRGVYPHWIWLPAARKYIETDGGERQSIKEARASSALWLYKPFEPTHPEGHVWHDDSLRNGPLENQQGAFPNNRRTDAMDTLGYIDYVMRNLGLFFEEQTYVNPKEENQPLTSAEEWAEIIETGSWRKSLVAV